MSWKPVQAFVLIASACGGSSSSSSDHDAGIDSAPAGAGYGAVGMDAFRVGSQQGGSLGAGFSTTCRPVTQGACEVWTCDAAASPASAGTITFGGTIVPLSLSPEANKLYDAIVSRPDALFADAAALSVQAQGADVPGFSASLVAPSRVAVTSPPQGRSTIDIDRSTDFTARWSGTSAGDMVISLAGRVDAHTRLFCRFPAADGIGTVPAAALQVIASGPGSWGLWTETAQVVTAGDWELRVSATYGAVSATDGLLATGFVTFQ